MNGHSIGYIYGWALSIFALSTIPPLWLGFSQAETNTQSGFLVTGLIAGFIGVALIIALKGRALELNRREKILLIISIWATLCVLSAIPFEASGAIESRLNAIFEATSAITTTGATTLSEIVTLPKSILLWRAQLQWIGGLLSLLTITYVLIKIWGVQRTEQEIFKIPSSSTHAIHDLQATIKLICPIYFGLSAIFILALNLSGLPLFDSICLIMSTISTGGMLPREGSLSTFGNLPMMYIMSATMFFGAVSILWSANLVKHQWYGLNKFKEPLWIGGAILALTGYSLWLKYQFNEGAEFLSLNLELGQALFDASSLISTSGFHSSPHSFYLLPPALILVIMIVGAGVVSTAGGIKFSRIMLMFQQSRGELRSLIYPHEVRPMHKNEDQKGHKYLSTVWVMFGLTILLLVILSTLLAYFGLGLEAALFTATSALMNCGPCLNQIENVHTIGALDYIQLASPAKIALIITMVIGRLEFLVAISFLHISFWRQ